MKTTKEDFKKFCKAFAEWMKILKVGQWEVDFKWVDCGSSDAEIEINRTARQALVAFSKHISRTEPDAVNFLAAHEAIELFISPLSTRALDRFGNRDEINGAVHEVVQGILDLLYPTGSLR